MQIQTGTTAFVTGASRGIGRALAERLAHRGAIVGLAARSTRELDALAANMPGKHHVLECDVADRASVEQAIAAFTEATGRLDVAIANAGITHYKNVADQPVEEIEQMTRVNWLGTVYTVKAALEPMLAAGQGHLVIVSSGAGLRSFPQAAAYGATKAAQRMFAEALRHELHDTGVSLTTVYPGEIATSLHAHEKASMPSWYRGDEKAAPAEALASRIIKAVDNDKRSVHFPPLVTALGIINGVSPKLADAFLRKMRDDSAAPRK